MYMKFYKHFNYQFALDTISLHDCILHFKNLYAYTICIRMNKYVSLCLFVCIIVLIAKISFPPKAYAQDQISLPSITPYWIKRQVYSNAGALLLSKLKSAQAAQDSAFSPKGLLTIIPSILGGSAVAAGSVFAWLSVQKRKKVFKKYMNDIVLAENAYSSAVVDNPKNRVKMLAKLKEDFSALQEKADLSSANRQIDEQQRTTISHTIERKLEEIEKTS